MVFTFKKVASILASAIMLSSTIGFAAAAAKYPAPFVVSGTADAAIVWGANAAMSDLIASVDVQQNLGALVKTSTSTTDASVSGEAVPLFSEGTKLYVNDTLRSIKEVLTKSDLKTVLADSSFSGIVDATVTQTITIGNDPRITFEKQPTSSDDPTFGLKISTSTANYIYNATATFSKAVDFTNASSEGEEIVLFGQKYTVASATDASNLILLQSAEKISLDSDNPTADVTIAGETYTVELVSASDTAATIKVTDSAGNSNSREVAEAASKKISGVTIAVTNADETNLKLSASIIAGSEKLTFTSGSAVTKGDTNTVVDGTKVTITGGLTAMTKLVVSVVAPNSDKDAIKVGESFVDPVFGTFKIDFSGLNIAEDSSSRESIVISPSGDAKMQIALTDNRGYEKTVQFAKNNSVTKIELMYDDDYHNITVAEMTKLKYQDMVVIGNQLEGRLIKLTSVKNQTTGYSDDYVKFQDVFSGDTYETSWTGHGTGSVVLGGKSYTVTLEGNSDESSEGYNVTLNYPDSASNDMIIYPSIQTSKGAKVIFYEPLTIDFSAWNGAPANITGILVPDGDGYETLSAGLTAAGTGTVLLSHWNITDGSTVHLLNLTANSADTETVTIGEALNLTFNATASANQATVYLTTVAGGHVNDAGLIIFEEKDDNNEYQTLLVRLEPGATGDDGIGIEDVERVWDTDNTAWEATMASDSKKTKEADLRGSIITTDSSDSDQKTATISYPDEQIYAQIYVAEESAAITPGSTGTAGGGGQVLVVKDTQVSSVATKNLVVIGGSCINTVAAKILDKDSPVCAEDFTALTQVGDGQYIIKTVKSPYNKDKIAMLVAGYEAEDTNNAVAKLLEGATSDAGTSQVYPISSVTTEETTEETTA